MMFRRSNSSPTFRQKNAVRRTFFTRRLFIESLERREVLSGFSTLAPAYLVPTAPSVAITPLITVGDAVPESDAATDLVDGTATSGVTTPQDGLYRMVGIPDGLGAFDNGNGTFTVLMNQEIAAGGFVRDHGANGAFVSRWVIDKSTLKVLEGDDLIKSMQLWNPTTLAYESGTTTLSRLCSADLPAPTAFFNAATGLGTTERIFMNGEESGTEGRAIGTVVSTGTAYQLPRLGRMAFENSVANPHAQDKTIVAGTDDGLDGQVYFYVGTKTNAGSPIDKAGLTNGKLFGVKVDGVLAEVSATGIGAASKPFTLADLGDVSAKSGATINSDSNTAGVTKFLRPEDGSWDPIHHNDFYFVTTNAFNAPTRLWRLHFTDIANPEAGGTIELLVDSQVVGNGQMFDNITVDTAGNVLMQEDVGNNAHIGKIWQYDISSHELIEVAHHNTDLFLPGASFLTQDEESSGIIDLSGILGKGYYLADVQAHYAINAANPHGFTNPAELVEGGQLLIINTTAASARISEGVLVVDGTINDDKIIVEKHGNNFNVLLDGRSIGEFRRKDVESIQVNGYNGDDFIDLSNNITIYSLVFGGAGNDVIFGSNGSNELHGGDGDDAIFGGNGADLLLGEAGNDILFGGNGADALFGGAGNDILFGENGADLLDGGDDEDWLFGGNGADLLLNGEHNVQ